MGAVAHARFQVSVTHIDSTLIGEVGHELLEENRRHWESQPRWLAIGSLFTVGGVLVGLNALFILLVAFGTSPILRRIRHSSNTFSRWTRRTSVRRWARDSIRL